MSAQMETRRGERQQQKTYEAFSQKNGDQNVTGEDFYDMLHGVSKSMSDYCAKRPQLAAAALLSVGFFLGWKLKPW